MSGDGAHVWITCGPVAALDGWVPGYLAPHPGAELRTARDLLVLSPSGRLLLAPMEGQGTDPGLRLYRVDAGTLSLVQTFTFGSNGVPPALAAKLTNWSSLPPGSGYRSRRRTERFQREAFP